MMNTLAGMGLAGSAVLALWLLASKVLKDRMPARWHYRVLKISLFFFLIPVGQLLPLAGRALCALRPLPGVAVAAPAAPAAPRIPVEALPRIPAAAPAAPVPAPVPASEPFALPAEALTVLAAVWAAGAAAMLAYKLYVYCQLRWRLFRQNRPVSSQEARLVFWACKRQLGIRGPVELRENSAARSPFAAGLLRPTVVIPTADLEREELRYLFLHELTHIRSGDLWVRLAAMLAQAVHWYNPLAWLLCRSIQTVSEQSCDERVACPLSREERYVYGNVILKSAAGAAAGSGDWAASLSTRESMERRLIRVLRTEKLKGGRRLTALVLALAILACGGGAALAARSPLPVSREAGEPAHTVAALPKEEGTGSEKKSDGAGPAPGETAPAAISASGTFPAPTEAQVLAAREAALKGMSDQQIQKLTETVKTANICLEQEYMYNDLFGRLEDPESLYWNYFHQTGEIKIAPNAIASNRYDAERFINLMEEHKEDVRNEDLIGEIQYIIDQTALARDTHVMEHVNNVYRMFHDLDYFLLRYAPSDVGPYVKDDSTITKYYGTLGAFYGAPAPAESETAGTGEAADRPVTTNGTPSEAFLKELREYFAADCHVPGITEDTPVLFGNHELILKRGGTLLPDEEFSSYTCSYGGSENKAPVIYKQFMTRPSPASTFVAKSGATSYGCEEYFVGNLEALDGLNLDYLNDLVDGEYPKNSRGESYGHAGYSDYVGYHPDLVSALGTKGEFGYLYAPDEGKLPHNLPKNECPHEFLVPLYDREHNEIGKFEMSCGGHMMEDVIAQGLTVEEAKAALAAGEITYPTYDDPSQETLDMIRAAYAAKWPEDNITGSTPILFGDKDLILSRGGTLLPDDDLDSYTMVNGRIYKVFQDKNGLRAREYLVGNQNAVDAREVWMVDTLTPDGDYPKNSRGESYGRMSLADYVGYWPDLEYLAEYPHEGRPAGYIYSRDDADSPLNRYDPAAAEKPRTRTDSEAYQSWRAEHPGARFIPLYDAEGEIIGTYDYGPGIGVDTSGMSVEEAKAALENPA